jgi:[protein-PII] uridylyltransferase
LHALRVHSASVNSRDGVAINTFAVSPHFGTPPAAELLRQQFILALDGQLDVIETLERRDLESAAAAPYRAGETPASVPVTHTIAPPRILWTDGGAPGEFFVQIRASDRPGLLARLTAVIERDGLDINWAKVTTLGSVVIDVFSITVPALSAGADAAKIAEARADLERDLYAMLPAPPRKVPEAS